MAQFVTEKKAQITITGNIGPNAYQVLSTAGIKIYTDVSGIISDVLKRFESGLLTPINTPSVEAHFGMASIEPKTSDKSDIKRIALAAMDDKGLNSTVSLHFGRCPYYLIVQVKANKILSWNSIINPYFDNHGSPGKVPAFIHDQGAKVIIAGGMGQRAVSFFQEFGIEAVTGTEGKIISILEDYFKGGLKGHEACAHEGCH